MFSTAELTSCKRDGNIANDYKMAQVVNVEPPPWAPRVHYGGATVPSADEMCLGGQVKFQRLEPFFPEAGPEADLLYFVSSCLPARWLATYWKARRDGRRIIWNHSAVSYRAVWPDVRWDDDNMLLEQGLHAADYVIYQSEFSRAVADRYLGPFAGPSEVLYNAVDTRRFAPRPGRCPGPDLTILLAGTQYRLSSLEIAFAALASLRHRLPRARLLVSGSMCWIPDSEAALRDARARVAALGIQDAVDFLGEYTQAQAPELYNRADILLHTRYDDRCPNVVIEALACGLPVVYSRTGGTPELVHLEAGIGVETGHSWDGECFAPPERWADALEQVADNREEFGRAARDLAVSRFGLDSWIERHHDIFQRVLATPQAPPAVRSPVSAQLQEPLRLLELIPAHVRQHEAFNVQSDGRSALAIAAANASHATLVVVDDVVQETAFSNAHFVSASVPAGFTAAPGSHRVRLEELLRASDPVDFTVEAIPSPLR